MIEFDYKGIRISATAEISRHDFKDANNVNRTRFKRNVKVRVSFWSFDIDDDLYELAVVKSTLNYFMQSFWKRSSKMGTKIELATSLEHQFPEQTLSLIARQKKNKHSLEVSLTENGQQCECIYLSGQEAILIDIAISKAIALLMPQTLEIND
jgi:hypothetical protein